MRCINHSNIFINGRFLTQPATGVQRYAFELLHGWDEMLERGEIDPRRYQLKILTPQTAEPLKPFRHIPVLPVGRLKGNLWEQVELPWLTRGEFLFNPGNIGPLVKMNQAVTIHDSSVFAVPYSYSCSFQFKYRLVFLVLAKTAPLIITVSQFSKAELKKYCRVPVQKIVAIPEGSDHITRIEADRSVFSKNKIGEKPYILIVGSLAPHKNLKVVFQAAAMIANDSLDFVCVGADFKRWFKSSPVLTSKRVKKTGYISDAELKALYQGAAALVFPSLYEGFGLPPLEAMACGCPVIAARTSSLPEVCGSSALYFDPLQPQDLVEKINCVIKNPQLTAGLREKGLIHAKKFNWSSTAKTTWDILAEYIFR